MRTRTSQVAILTAAAGIGAHLSYCKTGRGTWNRTKNNRIKTCCDNRFTMPQLILMRWGVEPLFSVFITVYPLQKIKVMDAPWTASEPRKLFLVEVERFELSLSGLKVRCAKPLTPHFQISISRKTPKPSWGSANGNWTLRASLDIDTYHIETY